MFHLNPCPLVGNKPHQTTTLFGHTIFLIVILFLSMNRGWVLKLCAKLALIPTYAVLPVLPLLYKSVDFGASHVVNCHVVLDTSMDCSLFSLGIYWDISYRDIAIRIVSSDSYQPTAQVSTSFRSLLSRRYWELWPISLENNPLICN